MGTYQSYKVVTTVEIPFQRLADLMVGALEGGSTYWCDRCVIDWEDPAAKPDDIEWGHEAIAAGADFQIWHNGEHETIINSGDRIEHALKKMADDFDHQFKLFVNEQDDAETSDIFFQLLCFNELVYG